MNLECSISEELLKKLELFTWKGEDFKDAATGLLTFPLCLEIYPFGSVGRPNTHDLSVC